MSFWVYMLRYGDGSYYTGHTDDLEYRLHQHEAGTFGGYTLSRKPLSLVYSCSFPSREEALQAERQIKGWSRKKPCCVRIGPRSIGCLVGNININGRKGHSTSLRPVLPSTSGLWPYAQGERGGIIRAS